MGWFKTGESAQKAVNDELVNREMNRKPPRFWMKPGQEAELIFVDDDGITFYEHNLKLNENWGNFFTCLKSDESGDRRCPLCESRYDNYLVTLYTVIDCTKFVDKKGATRQYERKILAVKPEVAKKIVRKKAAQKGSLVGCKFTVFRTSDKSGNSGDDFEFIDRLDLMQFAGQDGKAPAPFEYEKFYKPESYETLARFAGKPDAFVATTRPSVHEVVQTDGTTKLEEIPF